MAKNLVIVESPAKARTVGRFLGNDYTVKASLGHVRDLPKKELGISIDDGFNPVYEVLQDKRKVIQEVKAASKGAEHIYLATDPDREGEAISWHLVQAAGLQRASIQRVVFHEITQAAIQEAFRHPREIDMDLVNAQQARRILDRLVGYQLSPILWRKVGWRNLSAGRVQSVALRLVVERDREIQSFVTREYWTVEAALRKPGDAAPPFTTLLHSRKGSRQRLDIPSQEEAQRLTGELEGAAYQVAEVRTRQVKGRPAPPFITSTLQQEAWRKLRFPARKTMLLAQQLYEGIALGSEDSVGLITYMRTDSTALASSAVQETRAFIQQRYGPEYLPPSPRAYTKKARGAQEAHEAIRPTSIQREPGQVRQHLTSEQLRLYDLVWKRMLACQMADSLSDSTSVVIEATSARSSSAYLFRASGSVLRFPGYRAVYIEGRDDEDSGDGASPLPALQRNEALDCQGLETRQHFTQPPPRYTEASLVKALEEHGIGRPSTYAPIISTIQEREYVRKEGGSFHPTPLGLVVNDLLVQHFPDVVDPNFTARMEENLDNIARGERQWVPVLKEFYVPFEQTLQAARDIPKVAVPSEETCEQCERPMVVKWGRFGKFLSCSDFPECRNAKPIVVRTGVDCPRCGGELVQRRGGAKGKRKSTFYGCSNYPTCDFAVNQRPLVPPCPQCGELLVASGRDRARCNSCDYKGPVPAEERELVEAGV